MLLDALKNFSWYNEPSNVRFIEEGMLIETNGSSDFWQNSSHGIHKDNGHFFFAVRAGNFNLTLKWRLYNPVASDQCGIMARVDYLNWAKIGFLSTDLQHPSLGSIVTKHGDSDWAASSLAKVPEEIWFRLVRRNGSLIAFYSLDGNGYQQIRLFNLPEMPDTLKIGAYACSPQPHNFECILEEVELS